jgi:hypothetical protein
MIRRAIARAVALATILTPVAGLNFAEIPGEAYREGEIVVKFRPECTPAERADVAAALGATVKHRFRLIGAEHWEIHTGSVADAMRRFASDPRIEYIEPNYRIYLDGTYPDDPRFDELWGLYNRGEIYGRADADIDATDAWEIETGGDVIVGVCDSGVDFTHEDLRSNIYVNPNEIPGNGIDDDYNGFVDDVRGWDFGDHDNNPMDDVGHGTHVSGTIAAVGNNGVGVAGVNWKAKILPLKIVDSQGEGFTIPAARGIEYAVMMGARVTNHSWGTSNPSSILNDAIAAAEAAGVLTVASAGNAGAELNDLHQHFPAGLPFDGIVSVANTTRDDALAGSSNWSAVNVDLAAPGTGVVSTTPGNHYESYTGTSMSAPHVTGAIALIWAHAPNLTGVEVKQLLLASVDPLPDLEGKTVSGGRLNVYRALATLDTEAPAAVDNLAASLQGPTAASLTWSASGDDGLKGTAKRYDIRYSRQPIDETSFHGATRVLDPPEPQPSGSTESFAVSGLRNGTTYHFALRVADSHGNTSPISNAATVTTALADPPPAITVSPASLVKTLVTGAQSAKSFSIANDGTGELRWEIHVVDGGFVPGLVTAQGDSPVLVSGGGEGSLVPPVGATEGFLHGVSVVFDASRGQLQDRWDGIVADLEARGATVTISGDPLEPSALDTTDVLWLTDVPPPAFLTASEISVITQWVSGGGGLLLEGDDDITVDLYNRLLAGMAAGIEYSPRDGVPGVSTDIYPHETTDGVSGVLFDQNGSVLSRVAEPAGVLIYDSGGNAAAAAVEIGSGRVVALADELSDDFRIGAEDNRRFANRLFGWLAGTFWAAADPIAGVVPPGETSDVEVSFDARGRQGGIYQAELRVESNDPGAPSTPVGLTLGVTAAPDIAVSHTAVDFGVVFTTVTGSETLAVYNGGKETLDVNNVYVVGPDLSVDVSSFALAPDEGREFVVSVSPSTAGTVEGTLVISSNDPDDSHIEIPLTAEASDPPVISVAPDSLYETRFGDEIVTRTLAVSNDGEYTLDFAIVVEDAEDGSSPVPVSPATASRPAGSAVPPGEVLTGSDRIDGSWEALREEAALSPTAGPGLIIFGDDFEDGDFDGWGERGNGFKEVTDQTAANGTVYSYHESHSPFGHFNGIFKDFGATQPEYVSFYIRSGANDQADSYVMIVDSNGRFVTYVYCSSPGYLCVNAGNPGEDCSIAYEPERWYFVELKNIDFVSRTFDYYVDYAQISTAIPFMYEADDMSGMHLYNYHEDSQAWWDEIVVASTNIVAWLSADPLTGVVPPHASLDVDVTFDATHLYSGRHERSILISSNDPATPELRVPAVIDVTAVPNLAVSDTLVDFGKLVVGLTRTLPLRIINRSLQENLVVSDIVVDNPDFSVNRTTAVVPPNGRATVQVTFAAGAHGLSSGTLTIYSNDRDQPVFPVSLAGEGVDPPVISVAPDTIGVELAAGSASVETVLVSNVAPNPEAAPLEFLLWVVDNNPLRWLTVSPGRGTVAPGSTAVVLATFDATELYDGDYTADIVGTVNIPHSGIQTLVHTSLHVAGAPQIVVADSLAFGTAYVSFPVSRELTVKNAGTADLDVSDVSADRPEFTAAPTSFTVAPGDSIGVAVSFVPGSAGPITSALAVASNDTAKATAVVSLTALVLEAPVASTSVDSLRVAVRQERTRTETITLENHGASDLQWEADLSFAPDLAGETEAPASRAAGEAGSAAPGSLMDVLWYGTHGPYGAALWTTAFDEIEAAGGTVTESSDPMQPLLLAPFDVLWLGDTDTAFSETERDAVVEWIEGGGSLLIEAENSTAVTAYQQVLDALGAPIRLQSVATPGGVTASIWPHEITHGVTTLFAPNPTALITTALPPAGILANGGSGLTIAAHVTVGKGRVVVLTDWMLSDISINIVDNKRFMRQLFGWLSGAGWLEMTPLDGVLPAGESADIKVTFSPGDLPENDYRVNIDIATNDPALPVSEIALVMRVVPLVPRHVDLAIDAGLNLRSWNAELDVDSTTTILSPIIDAVQSVQGFDGGGLTFDPTVPPHFNTLQTMDHFHGYWFRLSEPAALSLDGVAFDHRTPLPLVKGYNLVGYFPDAPDSTAHAIESVADKLEVVLGYDGGGLTFDPSIPTEFNTLQTMRPGFGYWIKLDGPATLVYPEEPVAGVSVASIDLGPSSSAADEVAAPASPPDEVTRVVPSMEWIGVWGDDVRVGGELVETGTEVSALDAEGTVCGWCVARAPGEFGLMAVYGDDPATQIDEGARLGEKITLVVGEYAFEGVEWTGMGAVIRFNDVARLTSVADHLPRQTALYQNYPNPFNPATTIAYDLAARENVTLSVFNVQGKRVRVLVNGTQPPGRYRVEWDGTDGGGQRVATGVYFYRFEAGDYTRTRKMVLLK